MKHDLTTEETSRELVVFLRDRRAMTLKQIAKLIGVSESFICRVSSGERRFTLNHLAGFERALGESVPLLLLRAREAGIPAEAREAFREAIGILERCDKLKARLSGDNPGQKADPEAKIITEPPRAPARETPAPAG